MQFPVQKLDCVSAHVPHTGTDPWGRERGAWGRGRGLGKGGCGGGDRPGQGGWVLGNTAAVPGTDPPPHTHTRKHTSPQTASPSLQVTHRDRRRQTGTYRWTQLGGGLGAHRLSLSLSHAHTHTNRAAGSHTHTHRRTVTRSGKRGGEGRRGRDAYVKGGDD